MESQEVTGEIPNEKASKDSRVERIARAIYEARNGHGCKPWAHQTRFHRDPYMLDARAALVALGEDTKDYDADDLATAYMQGVEDGKKPVGYDLGEALKGVEHLVVRLRAKADIIEMGEKIAWGSETALMRDAAAMLMAAMAVQARLPTTPETRHD